jgi:hypothetical protein
MKVKVISELSSAKGIIPVGRIIEVSPALLAKLQGKVEPVGSTIPPAVYRPESARTTCYTCRGSDYWVSRYDAALRCRKCYPPAPGAEKVAA